MLDPITPEQRAELRRLHEAATPAPWRKHQYRRGDSDQGILVAAVAPGQQIRSDHAGGSFPASDQDLIAAARNSLPALLDAADERDAFAARLAEVTRDRDSLLAACKELLDLEDCPHEEIGGVETLIRRRATAALAGR